MSISLAIDIIERGWVPDAITRVGIRRLVAGRLQEPRDAGTEARLLRELKAGPLATHTDEANDQHYELPPAFFEHCLGPRLKYSCALFEGAGADLAQAEIAMLESYLDRGELKDGQRILELGCGWGSLTLFMAERLPKAEIVALSNSAPQREFIERQARERGLSNLRVITDDMVRFDPAEHGEGATFDRVVSIEMFEHMHNYAELLRRISGWLKVDGKLFVHYFCHRTRFYKYETDGDKNWMAKYFFTGGTMPSLDLLSRFDEHLVQQREWWIDGSHYQRTSEAWLENMDANRETIMPLFQDCYGDDAERWWQRWRLFYLGVAEMFGYRGGSEWGVAHLLLAPRHN